MLQQLSTACKSDHSCTDVAHLRRIVRQIQILIAFGPSERIGKLSFSVRDVFGVKNQSAIILRKTTGCGNKLMLQHLSCSVCDIRVAPKVSDLITTGL